MALVEGERPGTTDREPLTLSSLQQLSNVLNASSGINPESDMQRTYSGPYRNLWMQDQLQRLFRNPNPLPSPDAIYPGEQAPTFDPGGDKDRPNVYTQNIGRQLRGNKNGE